MTGGPRVRPSSGATASASDARPRIALVTYDPSDPEVDDNRRGEREDAAIAAALRARGATVDRLPWSAREVAWLGYDLTLVRTVWDYFDDLPGFRAWLERAAKLTTIWNPPALISWNADKRYLFELERKGVRLPPSALVARGERCDLPGLMKERGWSEVVIKRTVTGGAVGQHRIAAAAVAEGQRALDGLLADGDVLIQPFLPSIERRGEVSLIAVNGEVVHAVRKVPKRGDYRSQPGYGAGFVVHQPDAAERDLAERALAVIDHPTLHARVDMVALDDGQPALMELEVIEPYLFLEAAPPVVDLLADGILARL